MSHALDTLNEDWTKGTWDLYAGSQLVTTLPQLLDVLNVRVATQDAQRYAVRAMVARPAWRAAPAELKANVAEFLDRGTKAFAFVTQVKSEDEPRDEHGHWTTGGGASTPKSTNWAPTKILDYRDTRATDFDTGRKIPGSGQTRECDRCGLGHEVHVDVQGDDGNTYTVGSTCANATGPVKSQLTSMMSASKRVDSLKNDLARAADYDDKYKQGAAAVTPHFPGVGDERTTTNKYGVSTTTLTSKDDAVKVTKYPFDSRGEAEQRVKDTWVDAKVKETLGDRPDVDTAKAKSDLAKVQRKLSDLKGATPTTKAWSFSTQVKVQFFTEDGIVHPIRNSEGYDGGSAGESSKPSASKPEPKEEPKPEGYIKPSGEDGKYTADDFKAGQNVTVVVDGDEDKKFTSRIEGIYSTGNAHDGNLSRLIGFQDKTPYGGSLINPNRITLAVEKADPPSILDAKEWTKATPDQVISSEIEADRRRNGPVDPDDIQAQANAILREGYARKAAMDTARFKTVYYHNGSRISVANKTKITAAKLKEVQGTLDELNSLYPKQEQRNVMIGALHGMGGRNTLGLSRRGGLTMALAPQAIQPKAQEWLEQDKPENYISDRDSNPDHLAFWSPASHDTTATRSVMFHEYGHLVDQSEDGRVSAGRSDATNQALRDHVAGSKYGRTNASEAFAESFGEWHLSKGTTKDPLAVALSKSEGWHQYA